MISDGLTKGSVDRAEILRLYQENIWKSIGDKPVSVSLCEVGAQNLEQNELKIWYEDDHCVYSQWTTVRFGCHL